MQSSNKPVDSILSQKKKSTSNSQSGVVTYDLKDISGKKGNNGTSLGQIFSIIEQAKAEMHPEESKNEAQ